MRVSNSELLKLYYLTIFHCQQYNNRSQTGVVQSKSIFEIKTSLLHWQGHKYDRVTVTVTMLYLNKLNFVSA